MGLEQERLAGHSLAVFEGGFLVSSGVPFGGAPLFPWPELVQYVTRSPNTIIGIDCGRGDQRSFIPSCVAAQCIHLLGWGDPLMDDHAALQALVEDHLQALWAPWMELSHYACAAAYHLGNAALDVARARERFMARTPEVPEGISSTSEWATAYGYGGEEAFYSVEACVVAVRTALDKILPVVRAWLPGPVRSASRMRHYAEATTKNHSLRTPAPLWKGLNTAWVEWGARLADYRDLHVHFRPLPTQVSQLGAYVRRDQACGYWVALPLVRNPDCTGRKEAEIGFPDHMVDALVYCREVLFRLHGLSLQVLNWCRESGTGEHTDHADRR